MNNIVIPGCNRPWRIRSNDHDVFSRDYCQHDDSPIILKFTDTYSTPVILIGQQPNVLSFTHANIPSSLKT